MYYYIINPAAGSAQIQKIQDGLKASLGALSISGQFTKTTGKEDIPKLTELAVNQGFNTLIAVGGDGTVREVAGSLVGKNSALGIIPLGRTNEVAHHLGIFGWKEAGPVLATRRITEIPLVIVSDGSVMVRSAKAGLLTHHIEGLNPMSRFKMLSRELGSILREPQIKPKAIVKIDTNEISGPLTALRVTNGRFLGKTGLRVEFWGELSPVEKLQLVLSGEAPKKTTLWGSSVELLSNPTVPLIIDGEPAGELPRTLEYTETQKIKVIVGRERTF